MSSIVTLTPSYFSSRSTSLGIDARTASAMDSIVAIGYGLSLRFVVNFVGCHSIKISSVIIGLWEGIVTVHFMQKLPYSYDPYIAYGVRMFVDYLWTENLVRLFLVLVWTGMGVVLADIAPGIWYQTGMKRAWDHLRRDLYLMSRSMPRVALTIPRFEMRLWSSKRPRTPTVRFSPPRTSESASVISDTNTVVSASTATPTVITSASAEVPPPTSHRRAPVSVTSPTPATTLKTPTRLPGHFVRDSETETDRDTTVGRYRPSQTPSQSRLLRAARARERQREQQLPTSSSVGSESGFSVDGAGTSTGFRFTHVPPADELETDELYESSSDGDGSSSALTEVPDPDSVRDISEELEQERGGATPKKLSISLPPADAEVEVAVKTPLPPPDQVPDIPDGDYEDWEHVEKEKELAPPVPPKDLVKGKGKQIPSRVASKVPSKYDVKERDDADSNAASIAVSRAASNKETSKFGADDTEEDVRSKPHSRSTSKAPTGEEVEYATSKITSMAAPMDAAQSHASKAVSKAASKAASKAPTEVESHVPSKAPSRPASKAPTPPDADNAQSQALSKVVSRAASRAPPTPDEQSIAPASKAPTTYEGDDSQSHAPSKVHSRSASKAPADAAEEVQSQSKVHSRAASQAPVDEADQIQSKVHSRAASRAALKAPTPEVVEADSQSRTHTKAVDDSQSHVPSKVASRATSKPPSKPPTPAPEVEEEVDSQSRTHTKAVDDSQSHVPSKVASRGTSKPPSKPPTQAPEVEEEVDSQSRTHTKAVDDSQSHVPSKVASRATSKPPSKPPTPTPEVEEASSQSHTPPKALDDSQSHVPSKVASRATSKPPSKPPTPTPEVEEANSQSHTPPKAMDDSQSHVPSKPDAEDSQSRAPSKAHSQAPLQAVTKVPTRADTPQERDEKPSSAAPPKAHEPKPEPEPIVPEPIVPVRIVPEPPVRIELGARQPAFKAPSDVPSSWGAARVWGGGGWGSGVWGRGQSSAGWGSGGQSIVKPQMEPPKPKKATSTFSSVLTPNDSISNIGVPDSDSEGEEQQGQGRETGKQEEQEQGGKKEGKERNEPEVPPLTKEPSLTGTQAIASVLGLAKRPGSDLINLESNVGVPTGQQQPTNNNTSRPIPNMPDRISERDEESEVPGNQSGGIEDEDEGDEGPQRTPPPSFSTIFPDDFTIVPDQATQGKEDDVEVDDVEVDDIEVDDVEVDDVEVDEPLPDGSGRRLVRGVELKRMIEQTQRDIDKAARQMQSAIEDGPEGTQLAKAKEEIIKELKKDKRKLIKRRDIVLFTVAGERPEKVAPKMEFDANDNLLAAVDRLDNRIISLLEKGDRELNITFVKLPGTKPSKVLKAKAHAMKTTVIDRLKELDLNSVEDPSNSRSVKVTLPVRGES